MSRGDDGLVHGAASFQQLLPELYKGALDAAEEFLAPAPGDSVIDLYCGLGATLRRWQSLGARAMGVELSGEAVECARLNSGAEVLRGRCADRLPQLERWLALRKSRVLAYLNPPRMGLEPEVRDWLAGVRPERIAYLSCSPAALARDLEGFEAAGFRVQELLPWDFFPQTHHVETLALMTRS
jgi:tRNA/tmRNA/rRNA uracil-C5-methylase (TrmA/RlmC/RlmD family)